MSVNVVSRIESDQFSFLLYNEHMEFIFCLRPAVHPLTIMVGPKGPVYFTSLNLALYSVSQKASKQSNVVSRSC